MPRARIIWDPIRPRCTCHSKRCRIMFGSDQMIWPGVIAPSVKVIEDAPFLSQAQKRDILYNNAARFLRLSEETIAAHHRR